MADVLRELLIRLGLAGQAETKAGLEETAASVEKLAASEAAVAPAAEAATAATETQAAAVEKVTAAVTAEGAAAAQTETILETKARVAEEAANREIKAEGELFEARVAARFAIEALGAASTASANVQKKAYAEAMTAVAAYEVALDKATEAGAGNAAMLARSSAEIDAYNMRLQALSLAQEKAATSSKAFGAEAAIMRDNVAGAGRALASMGGGVASIILPAAAAAIGIDILAKVIESIDSKTKSWAASLVDSLNGLHEEDAAVRKSGESLEEYEARVLKALNLKEEFTRASILQGAGLLTEQNDVTKAAAAYEGYKAAQTGIIEQFPIFVAALKSMGVNFRDTHAEMQRQAELFGLAYATVVKRDGVAQANAWAEANKAALDRIISDYQRSGQAVPPELQKIVEAIHLVSAAETEAAQKKELHQKLLDLTNAAKVMRAQFDEATKVLGSQEAAAHALAPAISTLISGLENLKTASAADEAARKAALAALLAFAAAHGVVAKAVSEGAKATDASRKSIEDLGKEVAKLTVAYEQNLAKIREHATAATAAADVEFKKITDSIDKQSSALRQSYESGEIDYQTYLSRLKDLNNSYFESKRATVAKEDEISKEAAAEQQKATDAYQAALTQIEEKAKDLGTTLEGAIKVYKEHTTAVSDTVKALTEQAKATAATIETHAGFEKVIKGETSAIDAEAKALGVAGTAHATLSTAHRATHIPATDDLRKANENLSTAMKTIAGTNVPALNGALDTLVTKAAEVTRALDGVAAAAQRAFGGGGTAPAPEPGVEPGITAGGGFVT